MIATLLIDLAKANLAAAIPILCVIALRKWARGKLGARAAYGLWVAPLLAAGAVLLPHPSARTALPVSVAPIVLQAETAADAFVAEAVTETPRRGPDIPAVLLIVWLTGALAVAGLLARRQARFVASPGRLTPLPEAGVFRAERTGVGPAVVGVLRPKVVAPADFETRFAADERALILAHEAAHLSAHDAAINALACLVRCLCWFNPLVHVAARLMRVDQELACDAAVVGRFPAQRRAYAELLLKTQLFTQPLPLGCHWPAGAEHPLKERIAMLKSPLPARAVRRLGAAATLLACAGAAGLAWAASPAATPDDNRIESRVAIGEPERQAAQAQDNLHPNYTCDRALELSGGGCKIIRLSNWLALPTHEDIVRHYPSAALKAGVTAEVAISCATTPEGLLRDCAPIETTLHGPHGAAAGEDLRTDELKVAFGKAAVTVSRYYQFREREPRPPQPWKGRASLKVFFSPDEVPHMPGPPGSMPALPPAHAPTPAAAPLPSATEVAEDSRRLAALVAQTQTFGPRIVLTHYAPQAPDRPPVIVKPDWVEKPNSADITDFYPKAAVAAHTEAATTMHCAVAVTGQLTDCRITHEEPQGLGFGDAALALAAKFRMKPQTKDGVPTAGGEINIPIRFMLPSDPAASQPATPHDPS